MPTSPLPMPFQMPMPPMPPLFNQMPMQMAIPPRKPHQYQAKYKVFNFTTKGRTNKTSNSDFGRGKV
jgi:hypothetical protein